MKYSELIQFEAIEPLDLRVRLRQAEGADEAKRLVATYLISEEMAQQFSRLVFPHLRYDHAFENQGLLIIGDHGAGKSHLMSMLSAVAEHPELAASLTDPSVAAAAAPIAGNFKVLRLELGKARAGFRNTVCAQIEARLAEWNVPYRFPAAAKRPNHESCLAEMMGEFHRQFPAHGLLLLIDDLPKALCEPGSQAPALDLAFLQDLGAACARLRFRFIAGVQPTAFDPSAPALSTHPAVPGRFVQVVIPKTDLRFRLVNRLLKKTAQQQAAVREYLTPLAKFYDNMAERMDEFVAMFPIHPDYLEVVGRIPYAQPREVMRALADTVKKLRHESVPQDRPGLIAYDSYWDVLCSNPELRSLPEIEGVTEYNELVRSKIEPAFPHPELRKMALRLIHALSVHRLSTGNVYGQHGPTPTELRDMLCLHFPGVEEMGCEPAGDLLLHIVAVLDVVVSKTLRGQFISYNPENGQYYLHLRSFRRFVKPELVLHWVNGIPFVLLLLTAVAMLLSRLLDWDSSRLSLLITIHKTCAAAWVFLVPLAVLLSPKVHWQHVRPMLQWGIADAVWMLQSMRSLVDKKAVVPPAGRFNTGQKMNACLVMLYFLGFTATGTVMVLKGLILLPWYLHTCLFVVAAGSVGGHLFLALINPSTRIAIAGIFHGWSPMKYVEHHHPLSLPLPHQPHHDHGHVNADTILEEFRPYRTRILVLGVFVLLVGGTVIALNQSKVVLFKHVFARSLSHLITPRELSPKHRKVAIVDTCAHCHSIAGGVPDSNCEHCHAEIAQRRAIRDGYHGKLKGGCVSCHKEHPTHSESIIPLEREKFDHNLATFKRDGKHAQVACDDCHIKKRTSDTPGIYYQGLKHASCGDCHRDQHEGQMKAACEKCHSPSGWKGKDLKFTHDRDSSFQLVGQHKAVACVKCHNPGAQTNALSLAVYKGLPNQCSGCHNEPHRKQFAADCKTCHSPAGWDTKHLVFDHNRDARFPLVEKHTAVACNQCHTPAKPGEHLGWAQFRGLKSGCADCHKDPHQGQFAAACTQCHHTPVGWSVARVQLDHARDTKFPLLGKHATVDCIKCHTPAKPGEHLGFAKFRGLKSGCGDCHKDPHRGQFAAACTQCHQTPVGWSVARVQLDHARDTKFPLLGKHATVDCVKCHVPAKPGEHLGWAKFRGLKTGCADCHKDPHWGQFTAACTQCHQTPVGWAVARLQWDHTRDTKFPLLAKHATVDCIKCHTPPAPGGSLASATFKGLGTGCATCHKVQHPAKYGSNCTACHTFSAWPKKVPGFEHIFNRRIGEENLSGKHLTAKCSDCHNGVRVGPLEKTRKPDYQCRTCHQKDDPHKGVLGDQCFKCHGVEGWKGDDLRFDHNKVASFSLDQIHQKVACAKCHEDGHWKPLEAKCESCHTKFFLQKKK